MKVPASYYDEIFDFNGQWDVPSKCGLKILDNNGRKIIIVTELYQENPGNSVTYASGSLLAQICARKGVDTNKAVYIECNPDMNSKLSFYDEEYFEVSFARNEGGIPKGASYRKLSPEEVENYLGRREG